MPRALSDRRRPTAKRAPVFLGVQAQFQCNVRAANGEFTKSNLALVDSQRKRLYHLDKKIQAIRAAKGDPQTLFTPGNPNYVLDPNKVAGFMPSEQQIAAQKARSVTAGQAGGSEPSNWEAFKNRFSANTKDEIWNWSLFLKSPADAQPSKDAYTLAYTPNLDPQK